MKNKYYTQSQIQLVNLVMFELSYRVQIEPGDS